MFLFVLYFVCTHVIDGERDDYCGYMMDYQDFLDV